MTTDTQQSARRGLANFYDSDTISAGLADYEAVPVPRGLLRLVARMLVEPDVPEDQARKAAQMIEKLASPRPSA
ncbi:hypothetical protein [Streptomyces sp. NPDC053048]|uniref:hypothetical protein n=1 Tax=Streptomyces sp. NPDC053048 TaxID=3365694 RepID=UPI0037D69148